MVRGSGSADNGGGGGGGLVRRRWRRLAALPPSPDGVGGGGGSGFGPAGVAFETGVRTGDGLVTITYDPAITHLREPAGRRTELHRLTLSIGSVSTLPG